MINCGHYLTFPTVNEAHPDYPQRLLAAVVRYNSLHLGSDMTLDEIQSIVQEMAPLIDQDEETIDCEPLMEWYLNLNEEEDEEQEQPGFFDRVKSRVQALGQLAVDKIHAVFSPASATRAIGVAMEQSRQSGLSNQPHATPHSGFFFIFSSFLN